MEELVFFGKYHDMQGQIAAAAGVERAAAELLEPEALLRTGFCTHVVGLLQSSSPEAQVAACNALRAACRKIFVSSDTKPT